MNKKTIIISLFTLCGLFSSCDMDKLPYNGIATEEAIQSASDCKSFRELLYARFRGYMNGGYMVNSEIQTDGFHALIGYSNNYGAFYRWETQAADGNFSGCWSSNYTTIANASFLIEGADALLASAEISDADKDKIRQYQGEAFFARAFAYFELAQKFCKNYDATTAGSTMGVPLVSKYAPTPDAGKYPGRSSLEETYTFILSDLQKATDQVKTVGAQLSAYVTSDVVKALKARVALQMHDYQTAINESTALIESQKYPLITDAEKYAEMWLKDNGSETLWQIAMSKTELGNGLGTFINVIDELPKPSYVPTTAVLNLYDHEKDIRFNAYFKKMTIDTSLDEAEFYLMVKYPGNPDLYTGKTNYVNKVKAVRISEMYLIAAEGYAMKNDPTNASKMLNLLKKARIADWTDVSYTSDKVLKEVQDERERELFMEGFRLNDLRRWNLGVTRSAAQNPKYTYIPGGANTELLKKEPSDNRFVWAIPQDEIDSNPQMKQQQNPGY